MPSSFLWHLLCFSFTSNPGMAMNVYVQPCSSFQQQHFHLQKRGWLFLIILPPPLPPCWLFFLEWGLLTPRNKMEEGNWAVAEGTDRMHRWSYTKSWMSVKTFNLNPYTGRVMMTSLWLEMLVLPTLDRVTLLLVDKVHNLGIWYCWTLS